MVVDTLVHVAQSDPLLFFEFLQLPLPEFPGSQQRRKQVLSANQSNRQLQQSESAPLSHAAPTPIPTSLLTGSASTMDIMATAVGHSGTSSSANTNILKGIPVHVEHVPCDGVHPVTGKNARQRMGAFEVQLAICMRKGKESRVEVRTVHSKLASRLWPSQRKLKEAMVGKVVECVAEFGRHSR